MADFASEMAKLLPVKNVYEDAAQPAVRQAGQISGDLMKECTSPLHRYQLVAAMQDRFRNFIDKSVRSIPESRRFSPHLK